MARHSSIIAPSLGRGVRARCIAFAMMDGVLARRDNPLGGAARRGKGKAALGNVFNSEFAKCQRDQIAIFISEWPLIKALGHMWQHCS